MAILASQFVVLLTKAQGRTERYEVAPPAPFLARPFTLLVRNNRGYWEALLAPTSLTRETAEIWLDQGNTGFFQQPEHWTDTRYYDAFSAFCSPYSWLEKCDPQRGLVAIAAYGAKLGPNGADYDRLRKESPARPLITDALLDKVRTAASAVEIPDREPPFIPTRMLPYAAEKGLGWGECLAFWLYGDVAGPSLSAKQAGRLLGIQETAQVRRMARTAGRKLGVDSIMRLVPPWPKESAPTTLDQPHYDVPGRESGDRAAPNRAAGRRNKGVKRTSKTTTPPPNGPSQTGKPSGGGRGNNAPAPKGK